MRPSARHHRVTIAFHWMTFVLLLVSFSSVLGREWIEDDAQRHLLLNLHRSFGILALVIVLFRLTARAKYFSPAVAVHLTTLERRASGFVHSVIYGLLFSVPILGWLFTSASGKPISFFDLFSLPALLAKNRSLAENLGQIHEFCAYFLLALILIHLAAALWHHFVKKDHILLSMSPASSLKTSE